MKPNPDRPRRAPRLVARFVAISWRDLAVSFGPILALSALAIWGAIRLIQPAPPSTLTMTAGPPGSSFWNAAQRYRQILARNGITLNVVSSEGSLENLRRLSDPASHVDVGFVQSGLLTAAAASAASGVAAGGEPGSAALAGSAAAPAVSSTSRAASPPASSALGTPASVAAPPAGLVSLGSVSYVPFVMFYRGPRYTLLSEFAGKRLAIGPEGSGARALALALLKANGIGPGGATELVPLTGEEAARALSDGRIDAAFFAGDSAQVPVMARLTRAPGIRLFSFAQAEAYTRRFPYLTDLALPMGAFDLGRNLPPQTVHTLASTAELIARDSLHPALSDLLIEAAREVHGRATLLQRAGEFPAALTHDFPISDDAARYYKSGKGFLYRLLPFWLASLADRLVVLIVPIVVVLIPGLRLVPSLYSWRVKSRIYRWYGALIAIERAALGDASESERAALLERLDAIEAAVNRLKMPLAYADQFYVLREHIGFVRAPLVKNA
ncbi:TAXI family TRAP transporter solute-binding subunit [Trinickia caryophylli]|uniref:TAXI family TRAP transporter solute-binding subunit n=1 Tax=Trinickia caryophylli TaxID=28094 RepID=UPI0036431065